MWHQEPNCRPYLFRGLEEVQARGDELVPLLGLGDEALPPRGDAVRDLLHRPGVVVVVGQKGLSALTDVDCRGVGFLRKNCFV